MDLIQIVEIFVYLHGGCVRCHVGEGSVLGNGVAWPESEMQQSTPLNNASKVIAVVEDDPNVVELLHDMVKQARHDGGWRLHIFTDGQEAKNCLPTLGAHLILLDVGLPNLDGASLYKILRGHSNTKDIPIIVITGSHEWELHRMGLQTGLLLRKPFNIQELLFMISALLDPPASSYGSGPDITA